MKAYQLYMDGFPYCPDITGCKRALTFVWNADKSKEHWYCKRHPDKKYSTVTFLALPV